ncbi:hypothetical protein BT93_G0646 [Corymbia citriodora subsp. variegata]|nr:hypothetical protein BT93_G0646 [Corymbia citriodora subsp. variegata]
MAKLHVKAAVIGAGMSGLVAARELRREGHQVVVFERSSDIGGTWLYDPSVESDPLGLDPGRDVVHSSMYQSLRLNLPRPIMGFSDYPFPKKGSGDSRNFPGHEEVLQFLRSFAEDFKLVELIRFGHEVVRVERDVEGSRDWWAVEWRMRCGEEVAGVDVFEAVVVFNGKNTQPRIAEFPGRSTWSGEQLHSHNYRVPEPYNDKIVLIIGRGTSAGDIAKDILPHAKEVHQASRETNAQVMEIRKLAGVFQHPMIACAEDDGKLVFQDGSSIYADVIIHCTGELQSKWVAKVLSGELVLPSEEEMMSSVQEHYQRIEKLGWPKHHTHRLEIGKFEYEKWLVDQLGLPALEQWIENMALIGLELLKFVQSSDENWRDTWYGEKWMQEEGFGKQIP